MTKMCMSYAGIFYYTSFYNYLSSRNALSIQKMTALSYRYLRDILSIYLISCSASWEKMLPKTISWQSCTHARGYLQYQLRVV